MDKKLLSPAQQVDFLKKNKGITFNLINEQDAERFLENRVFLFKLKAFCKNYETYQKVDSKRVPILVLTSVSLLSCQGSTKRSGMKFSI